MALSLWTVVEDIDCYHSACHGLQRSTPYFCTLAESPDWSIIISWSTNSKQDQSHVLLANNSVLVLSPQYNGVLDIWDELYVISPLWVLFLELKHITLFSFRPAIVDVWGLEVARLLWHVRIPALLLLSVGLCQVPPPQPVSSQKKGALLLSSV